MVVNDPAQSERVVEEETEGAESHKGADIMNNVVDIRCVSVLRRSDSGSDLP